MTERTAGEPTCAECYPHPRHAPGKCKGCGCKSSGETKPFLKWAGGKRQLLPELLKSFPEDFWADDYEGTYYEPFIGGGALFFELRSRGWMGQVTLADSNELLVRTYLGVREDVEAVIDHMKGMRYAEKEYYRRRKMMPLQRDQDERVAAWFIYMNRTGFNGLYRVNGKGEFNVPFGSYTNPTICDKPVLRACSVALAGSKFLIGDFEKAVKSAEDGDLVYFDPPYVPVNATSDFTSYTRDGFTLKDQERLRDCAMVLKKRGVHVILSNADVPVVRKLYAKKFGFSVRRVQAKRNINSKASKRGAVGELIIL